MDEGNSRSYRRGQLAVQPSMRDLHQSVAFLHRRDYRLAIKVSVMIAIKGYECGLTAAAVEEALDETMSHFGYPGGTYRVTNSEIVTDFRQRALEDSTDHEEREWKRFVTYIGREHLYGAKIFALTEGIHLSKLLRLFEVYRKVVVHSPAVSTDKEDLLYLDDLEDEISLPGGGENTGDESETLLVATEGTEGTALSVNGVQGIAALTSLLNDLDDMADVPLESPVAPNDELEGMESRNGGANKPSSQTRPIDLERQNVKASIRFKQKIISDIEEIDRTSTNDTVQEQFWALLKGWFQQIVISGTAVVVLGSVEVADIVLAAVCGGFVVYAWSLSLSPDTAPAVPFLGSFCTSIATSALKTTVVPWLDDLTVVLAATYLLLPGYKFLLALSDLIANRMTAGLGRFIQSIAAIAMIAGGYVAGSWLGGAIGVAVESMSFQAPISRDDSVGHETDIPGKLFLVFVHILFLCFTKGIILDCKRRTDPHQFAFLAVTDFLLPIVFSCLGYGLVELTDRLEDWFSSRASSILGTIVGTCVLSCLCRLTAFLATRPITLYLLPATQLLLGASFGSRGLITGWGFGDWQDGGSNLLEMFVVTLSVYLGMLLAQVLSRSLLREYEEYGKDKLTFEPVSIPEWLAAG